MAYQFNLWSLLNMWPLENCINSIAVDGKLRSLNFHLCMALNNYKVLVPAVQLSQLKMAFSGNRHE
jgi:hypothetical protein